MVVQIVPQSDPYASVGQAAGEGLSTGLQMLVNEKMAAMQAQKLLERGFTPQEAKLWQQFTEGGKTHLAREIVERLQREEGFTKRGLGTPEEGVSVEADLGLTPKEKIGRESERYKSNLPLFEKAHAKALQLKLAVSATAFTKLVTKGQTDFACATHLSTDLQGTERHPACEGAA